MINHIVSFDCGIMFYVLSKLGFDNWICDNIIAHFTYLLHVAVEVNTCYGVSVALKVSL